MNNIFELVKVSLRETLDFRSMKKEKGKTITFGVFFLLMGAIFLFISIVYNLLFGYMFRDFNYPIIYSTIVMVGFASLLILTTSVPRVKSLFTGNDYDILASMPLTKKEIVASKIITFYLTEFLFSTVIMIPNIVINVFLWNDFSFILIGLIIMILLPAFPVVISCFVGTLIALFAEKSRFGNIVTTLLYTVFFVVIMLLSFSFEMNPETDADVMMGMTILFKVLNPTSLLLELTYTKSGIFYIIYCIVNLVLLIGITLFLSLSYTPIHEMINVTKSNVKYERKKLENKGQFKTLLGLELKRIFNSKLYFLNSCIGGILLLIASISISVSSSEFLSLLGEYKDYIHLISIVSMFILGMATPSASSISMEGKCFWITKSLPIDYQVYAKVKVLASVIIQGICSVISSIVLIVFFKPNITQAFGIVLIPLIYIVIYSNIGLLINQFFYKLNWTNEQQVVKNSSAVLLSMLAGFILTILIGVIIILLTLVNIDLAIFGTFIFMVITSRLLLKLNLHLIDKRINIIE